jgi:ACS family glucarate transporter-like MFS transporter
VTTATAVKTARGNVRYLILALIFFITVINYADRAVISIAGPDLSDDLGLSPVTMGYIFSAFGWSYVIGQLPGGWVLDRFGSKWVYAASITLWSTFTLLQGTVGFLAGGAAVALLFGLRFMVGLPRRPPSPPMLGWSPPGFLRLSAVSPRGLQLGAVFSTVLFAPLMAWIVQAYGWPNVFWVMGLIGIAAALVWLNVIHPPRLHPLVKQPELDHMIEGGALVDMEEKGPSGAKQGPSLGVIKQLLSTRMLVGVYVAQYCITTLTYFFLTWFPVYLVKERGLSILEAGFAAILPALCGFFGGLLGGVISDAILRRSGSLTMARKIPIVTGMLLSTVIIGCNYVDAPAAVVGLMALAFFGKGIGSLGWAVVADTSPKETPGLNAGLFNTFGNVAGITTPIAIGYIVQANNGSFTGALVFVAVNALVALVSYLFVVGEIRRVVLRPDPGQAGR